METFYNLIKLLSKEKKTITKYQKTDTQAAQIHNQKSPNKKEVLYIYIGRSRQKRLLAPSTCHILTILQIVNQRQNQGKLNFILCSLSTARILLTAHGKEGDTDDSSAMDDIIMLNGVLCFPVLGLRSLSLLVPTWHKKVCTEGFCQWGFD